MTTDSTSGIPLASPAAAAVFAALISRRSATREELARVTGLSPERSPARYGRC